MVMTGEKMPEKISLSEDQKNETVLVSGFSHPELAEGIARTMGLPLLSVNEKMFPNSELYNRYGESVRGNRVFIIQSHVRSMLGDEKTSVNDALMQQLLLTDAAFGASATEITAVNPYLGYQRQDRKSKGRESLAAALILRLMATSHTNRVVTMDMHAPSTQGVFSGYGRFDHLTAQRVLRKNMLKEVSHFDPSEITVVAPDAGASKMAERHRKEIGAALLHLTKSRNAEDSQQIERDMYVPEADGRVCILFDDMIDTAGTLVSASEALKNSGAKAIYLAATHGILSDPAIDRLKEAPIDRLLVTNTLPVSTAKHELGDKLRVVDIAPVIGRALMCIISNRSVSEIFEDQNHI